MECLDALPYLTVRLLTTYVSTTLNSNHLQQQREGPVDQAPKSRKRMSWPSPYYYQYYHRPKPIKLIDPARKERGGHRLSIDRSASPAMRPQIRITIAIPIHSAIQQAGRSGNRLRKQTRRVLRGQGIADSSGLWRVRLLFACFLTRLGASGEIGRNVACRRRRHRERQKN
jgi:hypothetical protein